MPQATQVADRWHLMENASHAFLDAVRKSMRQIRAAVGAAIFGSDAYVERPSLQGFLCL
jgi:NAD(P)H-hydrate repair Nnr-like enzyme with NAD(P)H-hydrate epimerase domain